MVRVLAFGVLENRFPSFGHLCLDGELLITAIFRVSCMVSTDILEELTIELDVEFHGLRATVRVIWEFVTDDNDFHNQRIESAGF